MSQPAEVHHAPIVYPDSDGAPVAETEVHVEELLSMREVLKHHFRNDHDVYVGANMFVYYEKGKPKAVFAPDVFVARGVDKAVRRTYRLWEEKQPPCFVLEISSDSTWLEDTGNKKALCARLGVREYFLFDPLGDYLEPRLQGFRLNERARDYQPIAPDAAGRVASESLGIVFCIEGTQLRCVDGSERLLRSDEARLARLAADEARLAAEKAQRDAEKAQRDAEKAQRDAEKAQRDAEDRASRAEAELDRLRARLGRLEH
jgi:Uma2 family endonuclease